MTISDDGVVRKFSARHSRTATDERNEQYHNAQPLLANVRCSLYKSDTHTELSAAAVSPNKELSLVAASPNRSVRKSVAKFSTPSQSLPDANKCKSSTYSRHHQHSVRHHNFNAERSPIIAPSADRTTIHSPDLSSRPTRTIIVLDGHRPRELCACSCNQSLEHSESDSASACIPLRVRVQRAESGWHSLFVERELSVRGAQSRRVCMDTVSSLTRVRNARWCAFPVHIQQALSSILPALSLHGVSNSTHVTSTPGTPFVAFADNDKTPSHTPLTNIFPVRKPVISTASASAMSPSSAIFNGSSGAAQQCAQVNTFAARIPLVAGTPQTAAASAATPVTGLSPVSSCSAFGSPIGGASVLLHMSPRKLELRLKSPLKSVVPDDVCPPTQPLPIVPTLLSEAASDGACSNRAESRSILVVRNSKLQCIDTVRSFNT